MLKLPFVFNFFLAIFKYARGLEISAQRSVGEEETSREERGELIFVCLSLLMTIGDLFLYRTSYWWAELVAPTHCTHAGHLHALMLIASSRF